MEQNPEIVPKDERNWGMFAHLAGFAGYFTIAIGFIIGPLLIWMLKKKDYSYVDYHGKEALNFQISFLLYELIAAALVVILIGFVVLPVILILHFILMIIGTYRASEGTYYRYPMTIRFLK